MLILETTYRKIFGSLFSLTQQEDKVKRIGVFLAIEKGLGFGLGFVPSSVINVGTNPLAFPQLVSCLRLCQRIRRPR